MARLGIKCKVYRNTATYGTPTWVEVDDIADTSVNPAWDEAEANTRANRVKLTAKTMIGVEVSGRIKVSLTGTNYIAFRDAVTSDTPMDLMILNGEKDENGVHGWRGDWHVFSGTEDQAMGASLYMSFTLKPACSENAFTKAVVTSGAPVFSAVA